MLAETEKYSKAAQRFAELNGFQLEAEQAMAFFSAQVKVRPADFKRPITSRENAVHQRTSAIDAQQRLTSELEPFEDAAGERLVRALELLQSSDVAGNLGVSAAELKKETSRLFPAFGLVNRQIPAMLEFRNTYAVLGTCGAGWTTTAKTLICIARFRHISSAHTSSCQICTLHFGPKDIRSTTPTDT